MLASCCIKVSRDYLVLLAAKDRWDKNCCVVVSGVMSPLPLLAAGNLSIGLCFGTFGPQTVLSHEQTG